MISQKRNLKSLIKSKLYRRVYFYCVYGLGIFLLLCSCLEPVGSQETKTEKKDTKPQAQKIVYRVEIKGAITPSATENLSGALEKAEKNQATALLVIMDTPGGLVSSMDDMVRRILSAKVPVLTYVAPSGASCGSAGVYILYASHLAAMAPATNLGSATPVSIGGGGGTGTDKTKPNSDRIPSQAGADDRLNLKRKILNHARAQIRSLAQYHGRNADFGEDTITKAVNLTYAEAIKIKAIDMVAVSEQELLAKADGRIVRMPSGKKMKLNLKGVKIVELKTDFRQNILDFIANPNVAYILMMLGILGIITEVQNPGLIFPGVLGAISVLLGLYAMQTLPLYYAAVALIGLAVILFILEVYVISYGLLSLAGIFSMVIGSLMLTRSGGQFTSLSLALSIGMSLGVGIIVSIMTYLVARSQKLAVAQGYEQLYRETGISRSEIDAKHGLVSIHGEIWQARTVATKITIPPGASVKVVDRQGLKLIVEEVSV